MKLGKQAREHAPVPFSSFRAGTAIQEERGSAYPVRNRRAAYLTDSITPTSGNDSRPAAQPNIKRHPSDAEQSGPFSFLL
jgi:hypothetical protein